MIQTRSGLGRWQATALALSFVVGSGILVLPILSLQLAGPIGSFHAWVLMTLIGLPLLTIFYKLSSVEGFTLTRSFTLAFGEAATGGAKITILGALLFGMPAMIYTTSAVLTRLLHVDASWAGLLSHVILTLLCLNHFRPLKKSSQISLYSAGFLLLLIAIAVGSHFSDLKSGLQLGMHTLPTFDRSFLEACSLTFFGYVGWESLGFFSQELRNPKKDLKWVFGVSFVVVSFFYLALSAVVTGVAAQGKTFGIDEGILSLLPPGIIRVVASLIVVLLLLANLNAWVFGGTKQMQELIGAHKPKRISLAAYYGIASVLLLLLDFKIASLSDLFLLSNQNWIVVYGGILAFYFKNHKSPLERGIGTLGSLSFVLLASGCSKLILLSAVVFMVSYFSIPGLRYYRRMISS